MFHKPVFLMALCLAPLPALASTVVMQFDEVSGNYTDFDDTIGDSANVDVTNRTRAGFGNAAITYNHLEHWENNYSDLVDVAFAATNGQVGELQFDIDSGFEATIDSFAFGNYFNGASPRNSTFRIFDSVWNMVWESVVIGHTGPAVILSPGVALTGTGYFQWGSDWNVGIDDFTYTVATASPIPLPAALPLLLLGLGGLGGLSALRRQRRA